MFFVVSTICAADYNVDYESFEMISFRTYYKDKNVTTTQKPKAPAKAPVVFLHEHKLLFESDMTGYGIQIISSEDGETVLYEDVIATDSQTYTLPEYLCGEYLIELTRGNIGFIGNIEL